MSIETWLAFVVATSILTLIPGPCVLLAVSQTLSRGVSAALMCILGDVVGGVALMVLSLVGVGAILAASATLFALFKWVGVLYMAYLGYCQIVEARSAEPFDEKVEMRINNLNSFKIGFITSLLNPKAIIFYMAFLPQFMNPEANLLVQFSILLLTSSVVIAVILSGYVLIASRTRQAFKSQKSQKYFGYSGGSFLIASSAFMASTSK